MNAPIPEGWEKAKGLIREGDRILYVYPHPPQSKAEWLDADKSEYRQPAD